MSKEIAAIVFSDLHIGKYNKFNQDNKRTLSIFRVLFDIKEICVEHNVPAIFCGDLLHKPEIIENELYDILVTKFQILDEDNGPFKYPFRIYGISGNHDFSLSNTLSNRSPSWLKTLSKQFKFLRCVDFKNTTIGGKGFGFKLYGIPYIDHNIGLNEYIRNIKINNTMPNILLLHTDYPGAKDTDGIEVNSVENLNINLLDKFDLVLIGHIHKPQRLSKKVYMVGAPYQQRRTDSNCELGYWELYSDMSMKFIPLKGYPKFIDVESEEDIKDDGNYYTIISKPKHIEDKPIKRITTDLSPKRLVKRYLKSKGEFTKDKKDILLQLIKDSSDDRI